MMYKLLHSCLLGGAMELIDTPVMTDVWFGARQTTNVSETQQYSLSLAETCFSPGGKFTSFITDIFHYRYTSRKMRGGADGSGKDKDEEKKEEEKRRKNKEK